MDKELGYEGRVMSFLLKKLFVSFLLPPGVFALGFGLLGLLSRRRLWLSLSLCFYLLGIEPLKDLFVLPLEVGIKVPSVQVLEKADHYVLLGGGVKGYRDPLGVYVLERHTAYRVLTALRLYRLYPKPIVVSGGPLFGLPSEAQAIRAILLEMGVREEHILLEEGSRDTGENALFAFRVSFERRLSRPVLITSAFHMKRALRLFRRYFPEVIPFPSDFLSERKYSPLSFFPLPKNLYDIGLALKEYFGILSLMRE